MRKTHYYIDSDDEDEQQCSYRQSFTSHESRINPLNVRKSHFNIDSDGEDDVVQTFATNARKRTRNEDDIEPSNTYEYQDIYPFSSEAIVTQSSISYAPVADDDRAQHHTSASPQVLVKIADVQMDDTVCSELRSAIQQPAHVSALLYAAANRPTSHSRYSRSWIYIYNYALVRPHDSSYVGKWMWFVSVEHLDDAFVAVAAALDTCHLGSTVKTAPPTSGSSVVPIIIYTDDYRDQADVLRVGLVVQSLLPTPRTISYKPDVFTLDEGGIHGNNTLKYKTITHYMV